MASWLEDILGALTTKDIADIPPDAWAHLSNIGMARDRAKAQGKPYTGWGNTKGVPMPTSPYGADFSSGFQMTPDFTLDLKPKDWKASRK